jgi:hypothetical protein
MHSKMIGEYCYCYRQWRTQKKIAKGGAIFAATKSWLIDRSNATSIVSPSLKFSKGGAICPSTCFLVFFKPSKITFRQPKGGGHGPLAPPLGTPLAIELFADSELLLRMSLGSGTRIPSDFDFHALIKICLVRMGCAGPLASMCETMKYNQ